jgi:hypothetical protein
MPKREIPFSIFQENRGGGIAGIESVHFWNATIST